MEVPPHASDVLAETVQQAVLGLAQQRWTALMDDPRSAATAEQQVAGLSRQVGPAVLAAGLSAR